MTVQITEAPAEQLDALAVLTADYPGWHIWRGKDGRGADKGWFATRRRRLRTEGAGTGIKNMLMADAAASLRGQLAQQHVIEEQLAGEFPVSCSGTRRTVGEMAPLTPGDIAAAAGNGTDQPFLAELVHGAARCRAGHAEDLGHVLLGRDHLAGLELACFDAGAYPLDDLLVRRKLGTVVDLWGRQHRNTVEESADSAA